MLIGSRLREVRKKNNYTQEMLAKQLGCNKSTISLYENEKRNPSLECVIEIMYLFGVSADYLLGADYIVEKQDSKIPKYRTITKDEMAFIEELRKDSIIYDTLFQDYKRGIEMIKKRI